MTEDVILKMQLADDPWTVTIVDSHGNEVSLTADELYAVAVWLKAHLREVGR